MPQYTFVIIIPNAGNKELSYSVNLDGTYEIYLEDYFQLEINQLPLRETLQTKLARKVSEPQLKLLINQWINEIKEGNRHTIIRLDLPPVDIGIPINQISPIQTTPFPSVTPPIAPAPKPPVKPPQFNSPAKPTILITTRNLWSQPYQAGQLLLEVKKQEIRKTGVLEYFAPQGQGLMEVGGLEAVKLWIENRREWFEQDSNPEMRPRAILLEGFPGCGKTFIARAMAQEWRVPQINFEISRLQSKWVGESESNTFQALRAIEASAPNILFMDEIEKAFAGVGGDSFGVSTRQFGTFLSWLNDHEYPIFFIATSNDRTILPPELFRAGRFDEIFIVMPPNTQERYEIIRKRAQAYRLPPIPQSTLAFLIENTSGFSGAELDKLVKEAIYLAGFGYLPTEPHWRQALNQINPQYRTPKMQALLQKYLRLLEEGGGKPASALELGFLESLILSPNQ